jgi:hypothetical protein
MKTTLLAITVLIATISCSLAGGNTSIVDLDKVTSIKIEDEKITVVGSGMLRRRVMSDDEHGDSTVFGQPTQMLYARVTDCKFEIIPITSAAT